MVRARLFSIDSAFETTFFFSVRFCFGFDFILVSFPKKVPLPTENSRKKRYPQKGDTHLREKDIQQVAAQELAASKMSSAALRRKNKNRWGLFGAAAGWRRARMNRRSQNSSGLYLSRLSLSMRFIPKNRRGGNLFLYQIYLMDLKRVINARRKDGIKELF